MDQRVQNICLCIVCMFKKNALAVSTECYPYCAELHERRVLETCARDRPDDDDDDDDDGNESIQVVAYAGK